MALTPQEESERKARINRGESGKTSPRLDHLHKKQTSTMSEGYLREKARKYPGGQAEQELKARDLL